MGIRMTTVVSRGLRLFDRDLDRKFQGANLRIPWFRVMGGGGSETDLVWVDRVNRARRNWIKGTEREKQDNEACVRSQQASPFRRLAREHYPEETTCDKMNT